MPAQIKPFTMSELEEVARLDGHLELTQEQAEALIQIQMASSILDGFLIMGKHYEADSPSDDYLELGSDELEDVAQGEYTVLQLWAR